MRKPRRLVAGARYHVVARANRREFILESDGVKRMLVHIVERARRRFRFSLDTLCIMDNHVHLLMNPGKGESLSRIMQWILSVFALQFNRLIGSHGHVWYDRFKSVVITTFGQFLHAWEYITDNPVAAGMVAKAGAYPHGGTHIRRNWGQGVLGPPGPVIRLLFPSEVNLLQLPAGERETG